MSPRALLGVLRVLENFPGTLGRGHSAAGVGKHMGITTHLQNLPFHFPQRPHKMPFQKPGFVAVA